MPVDTLLVYCGVYGDAADALADYELIKELHTKANLMDAYDAAVIERDHNGKVKIIKKHETPTRVGGVLGGGVGLATGLVIVLFPGCRHRWRSAAGDDRRWGGPRRVGRSCGCRHEPWRPQGTGRITGRRRGRPRRRRLLRHGGQGPFCHEAGAEGRGEAAQGRPEADRSRRRGGAEVLGFFTS